MATATCLDSFSWTFNSRGQSPCEITEALGAVCSGGVFNIPPIAETKLYGGPAADIVNECRCSSVFYSMLSACASCQNRQWIRWSSYNTNCSLVYASIFPRDLPTDIPSYGFQNVTRSDLFNVTKAFNDVSQGVPESTAAIAHQSTATTSSISPTTILPPLISTAASESGSTSNSTLSTSNKTIIGGVVGGICFVGIVAVLVFWYMRKKYHQEPSSTYSSRKGLTAQSPMSLPTSASSTTFVHPTDTMHQVAQSTLTTSSFYAGPTNPPTATSSSPLSPNRALLSPVM